MRVSLSLLLLTHSVYGYNTNLSPEYTPEGCLKCGSGCLSAAQATLVPCVVAAVGEATVSLFSCVKDVLSTLSACRDCLESLACCVTDSCSFCECKCSNLLKFSAPLSSPARMELPWLFQSECHFAYMGAPACEDCDGKRVYKSVNCSNSVFLHYHDYFLDGRWVVTAGLDDDDTTAVLRNLGDGFDDEECPERESYSWQLRFSRAPDAGWRADREVRLEHFLQDRTLRRISAVKAGEGRVHVF